MVTKYGYQPFYAPISVAGAGDTTIIPAVSGKSLRVVNLFIISSGTNTINLESNATTSLFGPIALTAQEGFVLPESENGWQETEPGEALTMNTTTNVQISGSVTYYII